MPPVTSSPGAEGTDEVSHGTPVLTSSAAVATPPPVSTTPATPSIAPSAAAPSAAVPSAAVPSAPAPAPAKSLSVGLINEGCTCYLNSLLQLLFHINYFRTAVYRIPPETDSGTTTLCAALQELFFEMQERTTPAHTRALTKAFGWGEEELLVQHDIQEMATLLRDTLEEKMKGTEAEGTIHQLFEGRGEQVVETLDHTYTSRRRELVYDIHLPLANHQTLMESLTSITVKDQLVGDNKYRVEEDGKPPVYKDAERGFRFCRFAPVTWFHLKRFDMDLTSPTLEMKKVNTALEFPLVLDLRALETDDDSGEKEPQSPRSLLPASSPAIYDLHGVIVHRGTVNSGHYYCYIHSWDAEKQAFTHWVEYDDDNVRTVTEELAVMSNYGGPPGAGRHRFGDLRGSSASAYVLSYVRRSAAPMILAPCPTDVITQSVKDALRRNMEAEERRVRRAEAARQQLTVYVLTAASLSACTLDLLTALLPPDMARLRRYAEATLELKKHDPLRLAYEQLNELLLAPCGFPIELCRVWRISGGPPTAPSQPGCGSLAYCAPPSTQTAGACNSNNSNSSCTPSSTTRAAGAAALTATSTTTSGSLASANSAGGGGIMAGERSSLNTRELHVGRALPTWQECVDSERDGGGALLLQDLLTPSERQKGNILGLFLQAPLLPHVCPHAPGGTPLRSHAASPTRAAPTEAAPATDATPTPASPATGVLCVGPSPVVKGCTVASPSVIVEMTLAEPVPVRAITVVLAHTATVVRSCTFTVQLYAPDVASPIRFQETVVVNGEDLRATWRQPKASAAAAAAVAAEDSRGSPKTKPNTAPIATVVPVAPYTGPVSAIKFQLTSVHSGKPLSIVDAHLHIAAGRLRINDNVPAMVLAEPGHDRVLLFFKLFDHALGTVRYLGEGILDRALTPHHCEAWLLHLAGAVRPFHHNTAASSPSTTPRLRFFVEGRASITRELRPDLDWMDNRVHSGSTLVVQRALVAPLYRHVHVETFYQTQRLKELVRVVEVAPMELDRESQYRERLAHFAAVHRSLPARAQAVATAVDAFNEYFQKEREKRMLETARAAGGAAPSLHASAGASVSGDHAELSGPASTSKRTSQTAPRVDVDVELNPFHSSLPVLQETVLQVTGQVMCTMLLSWCYDSICDALADHFMVTPGSIRLYQSRDADGSGPQRAPASTSVVLEDLLRLDAYTTINVIFFERLAVPRVVADQFAVFNVTLRDAEGHALHSARYRLGRADGTRQGVVRAVRQSIRDWELEADPWGTLEATLNAPQYTLLVVSEEEHLIRVIKEVRLTARDGSAYAPENALDADWQGLHLVLIPLGALPRGEERVACCHGEYRNGEVHTFGNPFVITVRETTTVVQAMDKMLACTHVPSEALHRDNHYAVMMLTERACYFNDWEETVVMYWRCTQNTSEHVPQLVLNYSNPLDKPGSRYVAHNDQRLKITK